VSPIEVVVPPLDAVAIEAARGRQARLTKPPGSLGRLEDAAVWLAGVTGAARPRLDRRAVIVMVGDHGVTAEGVSAYPPAVTAQMVRNFLRGGAAVNVLARRANARLVVVDMGVAADLPPHPALLARKIAPGTGNIARGPAMTRDDAERAVATGIEVVQAEIDRGLDVVVTGEMGIGNSTAAAAIVAAVTGLPVERVTGRGAGVTGGGWARKVAAVERALRANEPRSSDALDVLAKLGGYEIGGLAGVMIGAAVRRVPVVLDGFIAGAAALIAVGLVPTARAYLAAGHRSAEPGHRAVLDTLELEPLLDLKMRLGEGTGALLALDLLDAAVQLMDEMATFDEAGVSER
jgi:nicotinate-nucleotide--dimethylbenzimidazole phosphoribosyltransferase